jgi:hypothetical protein
MRRPDDRQAGEATTMQINLRVGSSLLLGAAMTVGCASAPATTPPAARSVAPSVGPTVMPTRTAVSTLMPNATLATIGLGDEDLVTGTYRLPLAVAPTVLSTAFPVVRVSVPDGWSSAGGWILNRGGRFATSVAVQFWNVDQVYRHPCQWSGTLYQPGPTVNDLAAALVGRPLRNATQPRDVKLDGYAGTYLEWSVPSDADFTKCDADGGTSYFESWIGPPGSDRYQQAPGQVDRLWILDVRGARVVIDAFSLPSSPSTDIEELVEVVHSIRFER